MKTYRLFILVVLCAALLLSACAPAATPSVAKDEDMYSYSEGGKASSPSLEPASARQYETEDVSLGNSAVKRMVIMNATLSIVVDSPVDSTDRITRMATDMGGYVVSSYQYKKFASNGEEVPQAEVTIRVPSERLTEAMDRIKSEVRDAKLDVTNEQVSGQDVTQEYTDLASRLRNLEATEEQLLKIQEAATTTEDIMMVFNQITQVREEIEVIKGQMQYYEESARLSSITVTLEARVVVEPVTVAGWQPEGIVRDALQALVDAGKWLVEVLIWLALYVLPIALVLGVPTFFIVRAVRRHQRKATASRVVPPPAEPHQ